MAKTHTYELTVTWTGNAGTGTSSYQGFERSHDVSIDGKPTIPGSADPAFRGARERWNPEELLVASLAQCHMLWYLVLCAKEGIVVTEYVDHPSGTLVETPDGGGHFEEVMLHPEVTITTPEKMDRAAPCTSVRTISATSPAPSISRCAVIRRWSPLLRPVRQGTDSGSRF